MQNKPRCKNRVNMKRLECYECGTEFQCGSIKEKLCWCNNLPNLRMDFDLAGRCVCPDCLTLGKAKQITKMRKKKNAQRRADKLELRVKYNL